MADDVRGQDGTGGDTSVVHRKMDDMYRLQRHIYDLSRAYYLLGRDQLIAELDLNPGETVCEIGCGTGRNLVLMARRYPQARLMGLDASTEMLRSARAKADRAGLAGRLPLVHGFAEQFDPAAAFGLTEPLDRIVFSYSLSMIPPWRESIEHALRSLKPGGRVHIVDFGDQAGLPGWFRGMLFRWLDLFGVHVRPELLGYLRELKASGRAEVDIRPIFRGYAFRADLRRLP
ncbi:class I SAM-dependent methyltransferase [Thalassobaculum salexigens]|uniref:class I SAM-dependent methyltransferase n=1 Tax=Thalassobaculum salexigens TaxID=455360 RepID=UPI00248DE9AC|nr:class I SAM-dependent methyltransferase [Thalassobaculum salexigens]